MVRGVITAMSPLIEIAKPFSLQITAKDGSQGIYEYEFRFDHPSLPGHRVVKMGGSALRHPSDAVESMARGIIINKREELIKEVLSLGDYPEVRIWAYQHMTSGVHSSLLNPRMKIPGFVWPVWKKKHPEITAKKDGGLYDLQGTCIEDVRNGISNENKQLYTEEEVFFEEKAYVEEKMPEGTEVTETSPWSHWKVEIQESGSEKMATIKKRVVTKKGAPVKKDVKTPKCVVHSDTFMKFDMVINKWTCPHDGCKVRANPKKGNTDNGEVILGKGTNTLRYVCDRENGDHVILISDDNVALDITDMVDIEEIKEEFGLDDYVEEATSQTVSISIPKRISLSSRISVTNLRDYNPPTV